MRRINKVLSVILTLALIFTSLCFTAIDFGAIKAKASTDATAMVTTGNRVALHVPEAIYLYPNIISWKEATATPFQYYIQNNVNTSNIYSDPTPRSTKETSGTIYFAAEDISSVTSITGSFVNESITALTGGSITVSSLTAQTGGYYKATISAGTSPSLAADVTGCFIKWTVTYKNSAGETLNAFAYTYVYKPYVTPYGAQTYAINNDGVGEGNRPQSGAIAWVSGVHSIDTTSIGTDYPRFGVGTGAKNLGAFISDDNTGYAGTTVINGAAPQSTAADELLDPGARRMKTPFSSTDDTKSYFYANQTGHTYGNLTGPDWVTTDASVGFDVKSFEYSKYEEGEDYVINQRDVGPMGVLRIDTSRYTNLNQIPNLGVGLMGINNRGSDEGGWFVATVDSPQRSGDTQHNDAYASRQASSYLEDVTTIFAGKGTTKDGVKGASDKGIKYAGAWVREIDSSMSKYSIRTYFMNRGGSERIMNFALLHLSPAHVDKSALRNAVNNATTKMAQLGVVSGTTSATNGINSIYYDITSSYWTTFTTKYINAVKELTSVDKSYGTAATLATELEAAVNELLAGKGLIVEYNVNAGADTSATVSPVRKTMTTDKYGTLPTPTRTGYTFSGWCLDKEGTQAVNENTAVSKNVLYAKWTPINYTLSYDNLFRYHDFVTNTSVMATNHGGHVTTSFNEDDYSITIVSDPTKFVEGYMPGLSENVKNDNYTNYSPALYAMTVKPNTEYIVTYDVTVLAGSSQFYVFTYKADNSAENIAGSNYPHAKLQSGGTFTTGANTTKLSLRVGTSGARDANVTFRNIRIIEKTQYDLSVANTVYSSMEKYYPYNYGANYGTLLTPTRQDYRFDGWYSDIGGTGSVINSTTANTAYSRVLYSKWTPTHYYIAFDANSGTGSMETQRATIGTNFTLPENTFTKTGYTFAGWAISPTGSAEYSDKAGVQLATSVTTVTLYAKWIANGYTINYDANGGTGNMSPQSATYDTTVVARQNGFTKTGYTFSGWKFGNTIYQPGADLLNLATQGSVTLTAQWTPITYTINFDVVGASVPALTVTYDENANRLPVGAQVSNYPGWHFVEWKVEATNTVVTNDNYDTLVTVNGGSVTVKAMYQQNSYTVVFNGNGATGGATQSQTVTYEQLFALNANGFTKTGYIFKGWATSENGEVVYANNASNISKLTTEKDGVVNLYAVWEANTYAVHFNNNNGSGTMPNQAYVYDVPQNLSECTFYKTGYHFMGWATSENGNVVYADKESVQNLTAERGAIVTLYAVWEINEYTVVFNYKNQDGTDATVTREGVDHGTAFSDIAPSASQKYYVADNMDTHFVFNGWGTNAQTITQSATYTAQYTEEAHVFRNDILVTTAPTCIDPGTNGFKCSCGYAYTESVEAIGHSWQEIPGTSTATCLTAGVVNVQCSTCKSTAQQPKDATGHSFGATVSKKEASCTLAGNEAYKQCNNCSLYFEASAVVTDANGKADNSSFIIAIVPHTETDVPETPATCTDDGLTAGVKCSVCGLFLTPQQTITALGHVETAIEAVPATCTKDGATAGVKCSRCEEIITAPEVIPALNHENKAPVNENINEATCLTAGSYDSVVYCNRCSVEISRINVPINATGHSFTATVEYLAPSCTATGNLAYKTCESCNLYFAQNEANNSVNGKSTNADFIIGKVAHTPATPVRENEVAPGCTTDGSYDEVVYCSECSTELSREEFTDERLGHSRIERQENVVGATCTTAGSYDVVGVCERCDVELDRNHVSGVTLPHAFTQKIINEAHLKTEATCSQYAVYFYDCADCTAISTEDTFEYVTGGYNANNHVGTTSTNDEDIVAGTCSSVKTWNEVTRCDDCNAIITSVAKTGAIDSTNHVGETEIREENIVPGTCTTVRTWNDVTYCLACNTAIGTTPRTGELDASNHSTNETVLKNTLAATCSTPGYTGDLHCKDCDAIVENGSDTAINPNNHETTLTHTEGYLAPTCITVGATGNELYNCCNAVKTASAEIPVNPNNHETTLTHTEGYLAPTCSTVGATGNELYNCCNAVKTVSTEIPVNPNNHETEETHVLGYLAPTCCNLGASGAELYNCCNAVKTAGTPIAKDPSNHEGTETHIEGAVAATCYSEGFSGNEIYDCCNAVKTAGTTINKTAHTPGSAVKENMVNATATVDGSYDEVVYCTVSECGHEISRTHKTYSASDILPGVPSNGEITVDMGEDNNSVSSLDDILGNSDAEYESNTPGVTVDENGNITATQDGEASITITTPNGETIDVIINVRTLKTIRFIVNGVATTQRLYVGDTATPPTVSSYTGANGFVHTFKHWMFGAIIANSFRVNGNMTFTAVFTESCDYTNFDSAKQTLNQVLDGNVVDQAVLNSNQAEIQEVRRIISEIDATRNTRDKSQQSSVDLAIGRIENLLEIIYPDAGARLEIVSHTVYYSGGVIDLKAYKMPTGVEVTDAVWTSSNEDIAFFSKGKLYAVGTGVVTITATRGALKATKRIEIISGYNTRDIVFVAMNKLNFVVLDYYTVTNSGTLTWSNDSEVRFKVKMYASYPYATYIVYMNGVEMEQGADGYYTVPAGTGDVRITVTGGVYEDDDIGTPTRMSFWEWLIRLFRKIIALITGKA